ncbi:MAG: SH3 domain-containing protein [Paracoccaceae bacterium]|nr:SH3 domain-containing protein [Paracoccaceae bacterium]
MTTKLGRMFCGFSVLFSALILAATSSGIADENPRGSVTNLPLPRFVSLKASEGNVRRGPSLAHKIDWVFKHRNMPLQIVGEYGNWRRIKDRDGAGGWMHYSLLSGSRMVIISGDRTPLYILADEKSKKSAEAEDGALAKLEDCSLHWCFVRADNAKGWIPKSALWGVDEDEIRN